MNAINLIMLLLCFSSHEVALRKHCRLTQVQTAIHYKGMKLAGSALSACKRRVASGREARQHLQRCQWYPQAWGLWTCCVKAPVGNTFTNSDFVLACFRILLAHQAVDSTLVNLQQHLCNGM